MKTPTFLLALVLLASCGRMEVKEYKILHRTAYTIGHYLPVEAH